MNLDDQIAISSQIMPDVYKIDAPYGTIWKKKFVITYNPGVGGTGVTQYVKNPYDEYLMLKSGPELGFSYTGFTFVNWRSTTNIAYNPSSSYQFTNHTTLLAQWRANTYMIVFYGNGGSTSSGTTSTAQSMSYGQSRALVSNQFTRAGYAFCGWATSPSGSSIYSDGQVVANLTSTNNGVVNLYATWVSTIPESTTVTIRGGEGDQMGTNLYLSPTAVGYDDAIREQLTGGILYKNHVEANPYRTIIDVSLVKIVIHADNGLKTQTTPSAGVFRYGYTILGYNPVVESVSVSKGTTETITIAGNVDQIIIGTGTGTYARNSSVDITWYFQK